MYSDLSNHTELFRKKGLDFMNYFSNKKLINFSEKSFRKNKLIIEVFSSMYTKGVVVCGLN